MALKIEGTLEINGETYEAIDYRQAKDDELWFFEGTVNKGSTTFSYIILREVKPPHVYKVGDWVRVKESRYGIPVGTVTQLSQVYSNGNVWLPGDLTRTEWPDGTCWRPWQVEPCDPPAPKYRPFANAEEFKPHRDRWLRNSDKGAIGRVHTYNDRGVNSNEARTYEQLLEFGIVFDDDGTPCGVKLDQ